MEKTLWRLAVALAGCVPVLGGGAGVILGPRLLGDLAAGPALQSHFRYLSGLLLAMGVAFWAAIPRPERAATVVRVLTAVVVAGGLARLADIALTGRWPGPIGWALVMELMVTPALCLWRERFGRG